jgi:hypothetical protein
VLRAHGRLAEPGAEPAEADDFSLEQPVLLSCYDASARGRDLMSERAGRPTLRLLDPAKAARGASAGAVASKGDNKDQLLARVDGVSVHAATCVDGRDRKRLERLCQYITRPALAQHRLLILEDGRVRYHMKRVWADGTQAIVLDPLDFIARLCALVPPPYFNLIRFHGVFAPNALLRSQVVPDTGNMAQKPQQLELFTLENYLRLLGAQPANDAPRPTPGRRAWAELLRRTFAVDVSVCPKCSGRMRLLEIATSQADIQKGMARAGLGPMPPPESLPDVPGQLRLPFGRAD